MRARHALPLLAAVAVAACEPTTTAVAPDGDAPLAPVSMQQVAGAPEYQESPQHVIFTSGKKVDDIAAAVVAEGGSILFQHESGCLFTHGQY